MLTLFQIQVHRPDVLEQIQFAVGDGPNPLLLGRAHGQTRFGELRQQTLNLFDRSGFDFFLLTAFLVCKILLKLIERTRLLQLNIPMVRIQYIM